MPRTPVFIGSAPYPAALKAFPYPSFFLILPDYLPSFLYCILPPFLPSILSCTFLDKKNKK
jgi:hypothetical protein